MTGCSVRSSNDRRGVFDLEPERRHQAFPRGDRRLARQRGGGGRVSPFLSCSSSDGAWAMLAETASNASQRKRPNKPAFLYSDRAHREPHHDFAAAATSVARPPWSLLLGDAGRLAAQAAQVIELGAADLAAAHDLDRVDHRRVEREHALDALAVGNLADREVLVEAARRRGRCRRPRRPGRGCARLRPP